MIHVTSSQCHLSYVKAWWDLNNSCSRNYVSIIFSKLELSGFRWDLIYASDPAIIYIIVMTGLVTRQLDPFCFMHSRIGTRRCWASHTVPQLFQDSLHVLQKKSHNVRLPSVDQLCLLNYCCRYSTKLVLFDHLKCSKLLALQWQHSRNGVQVGRDWRRHRSLGGKGREPYHSAHLHRK